MSKLYLSGAIAHLDLDARKMAFKQKEEELSGYGFEVFNPFDNGLPDDAPWREHMRADIKKLLECDYIYMMLGWEKSKGCKLELDVASSCGISVMIEHNLFSGM